MNNARMNTRRHRGYLWVLAALAVAFSSYIQQVVSLPADPANQWPSFPRRNIAALARDGFLRNSASKSYKRGIATLAKNGLLPTYRSPYDDSDKQDDTPDESQEKRNYASIARLRSYAAVKRNIQALARDGYRFGRGQYNPENDKRNIAALARNGLIHKKSDANEEEYYYPFYQNPIPPVSEMDTPFDINELYDIQQSFNPDMFPPMSQVFKRSTYDQYYGYQKDENGNPYYFKKSLSGSPVHGLYRPNYSEQGPRVKRYIAFPDVVEEDEDLDDNSIDEGKRSVDDDVRDNFEKRHIGSLARLGLLPSFRYSGGRYSRSGRARLLWPTQGLYRKHSADENFGIREYFTSPEVDTSGDPDDADISPAPVPPHSHPTGRILHRPLSNDIPNSNPLPAPPLLPTNFIDNFTKNRWQSGSIKETPKFYYFRSLKVPYHTSGKRYLLLPAVDNIMLRKTYRNSSLPSRRKNQ